LNNINRRPTQILADNNFPLADLARENLHALRSNRFLKRCPYSAMENNNNIMNLFRHNNINNRAAIDVFFAARVERQKGPRKSA
jgi:hypothetical protein